MTVTKPTLTVSLTGTNSRAVSVTVSSFGTATFWTLRRTIAGFDSGGEPRYYIRGAINQTTMVTNVIDTDFPQNTNVKYIATVTDGATTQTSDETGLAGGASVNIDLGADYICPMTAVAAGTPVVVSSLQELTFSSRTEILSVLSRRDRVAVGEPRQYPTFTLGCWTLTAAYQQEITDILYTSGVVLFSPRYPSWVTTSSPTALYLAVSDVRMIRESHLGAVTEKRWELDVTQVGAVKVPRVTSLGSTWTALPNPAV